MATKKNPLDNYKTFLLSRLSITPSFVEFLDFILVSDEDAANYCFHRIMVAYWTESTIALFETLNEVYGANFIPVKTNVDGVRVTFYTTSLLLVNKIVKLDFMFPYQRNMYNIEIVFNDKRADDLLGNHVKIEDIVSGVVSRRFTDEFKLNLSNFCNDQDFEEKNINFYKISLLSYFKLLMLRIGRDTKELDLSSNNLSQPPLEILNFFIKGDLIGIDFRNNNIANISDLTRVSSKIEKLWLEGNPLCEEMEPAAYVKNLTTKFPRLSELDGVKLTSMIVPIVRNFIVTPSSSKVKMFVEKFLTVYFTYYDSPRREGIDGFYREDAKLSISCKLKRTDVYYENFSRNILDPTKKLLLVPQTNIFTYKSSIYGVLQNAPQTYHDPTTFTVDVIHADKNSIIVVIDGLFKELPVPTLPQYYQFRRTFVFSVNKNTFQTTYHIANDMFHLSHATQELIDNGFKVPIRNMNSLALIDPDDEDKEAFITILMNITQLKKDDCESRLRITNWHMLAAVMQFSEDLRLDKIPSDKFIEEDDLSDMSALIDDDEID